MFLSPLKARNLLVKSLETCMFMSSYRHVLVLSIYTVRLPVVSAHLATIFSLSVHFKQTSTLKCDKLFMDLIDVDQSDNHINSSVNHALFSLEKVCLPKLMTSGDVHKCLLFNQK